MGKTYGVCDIGRADLADVLDSSFATPRRGLLPDDAHLKYGLGTGRTPRKGGEGAVRSSFYPTGLALMYGAFEACAAL